jgi:hypothetical protein
MSVILAKDSFAQSSDQKWPKALHAGHSPQFSSSGVLLVGHHSTDLRRDLGNVEACAVKVVSRMSQAATVCDIVGDDNKRLLELEALPADF